MSVIISNGHLDTASISHILCVDLVIPHKKAMDITYQSQRYNGMKVAKLPKTLSAPFKMYTGCRQSPL